MGIAKIIEVSSESPESFDDATRRGIARVSSTVGDVRGAWIKDQKVLVEGERITSYRVDMKVTFELRKA